MSDLSRRQFLGRSLAAGAAGFAIGGTKSSGRVIGANDAIRIGIAGLNTRGGVHVDAFGSMKEVDITYLIDPDARTFKKRIDQCESLGAGTPKTLADIRKALDDPNLDAVAVATPNHWHTLITVWACQAGKDVYVEKPCSHNVHEGRVCVEAARKYNRVVQHGTQSRAEAMWADLATVIKEGKYGKLLVSRGLCYKPRTSIGIKPDTSPPPELDFNLWTGPAPERPFNANIVPYNWHWFWDFGNGDIGNQGVHQMDIARWLIPGATVPKSVQSLGGRFGYTDQGETPNSQIALFDFDGTQLIFEVRGLKTGSYNGEKVGNVAHFEDGIVHPTAGVLRFFRNGAKNSEGEPVARPEHADESRPGSGIFGNFIAAVRSRKTDGLFADILEGHYSSTLCHLANISYRLGESVPFNEKTKAFGDNKAAYETLARMEDHLAGDNGLKLDGLSYRLGRKLTFDAGSESFPGDAEANALLTRHYRKPFAVPDKIV